MFGGLGQAERTLCRSAASAPTMSFSRSLIMRRSAYSCWIRNCRGRVLPELKAALARCTTSLILFMVPGERCSALEQGRRRALRSNEAWEEEDFYRIAGKMACFCLCSSLTQTPGPFWPSG